MLAAGLAAIKRRVGVNENRSESVHCYFSKHLRLDGVTTQFACSSRLYVHEHLRRKLQRDAIWLCPLTATRPDGVHLNIPLLIGGQNGIGGVIKPSALIPQYAARERQVITVGF